METRYILSPGSRRDIRQVVGYLAARDLSIARAFSVAAEQTLEAIVAMPRAYRRLESEYLRLGEVRWRPLVSPFGKYLVFYRPLPTGQVVVLRIIDGRRDPFGRFGVS